jgi:hypothetical protein
VVGRALRAGDDENSLLFVCFSVAVEEDEREDEGGICEDWLVDDGVSAIEGDDGASSSGLAIRSPPIYVSVRLISPFMAAYGTKRALGVVQMMAVGKSRAASPT